MLTRNFKLEKEYGAAYTGGTFRLLKDGRYALALKDEKVNLIHVDTAVVLGTLAEENEAVITFDLSPNQNILATTTKNYMVKAYRLPTLPEPSQEPSSVEAWKPELFQSFRLVGCLGLEVSFDTSSRFLALGTSDS